MPFRKFFDRSAKPEADAAPDEETADATEMDVGDEVDPEFPPEHADQIDWRARAEAILPTGASTGSKRKSALYGSDAAAGPTHFSGAVGCRVFDGEGNEYVDCTM